MLQLITLLTLLSMTFPSSGESQPGETLAPCPDSPNCVSSQATNPDHHVEALQFSVSAETAWQQLLEILKHSERLSITGTSKHAIHAQVRSQVFGFVDDIQFVLWPEQKQIHVRSASRSGCWDMGLTASGLSGFSKD